MVPPVLIEEIWCCTAAVDETFSFSGKAAEIMLVYANLEIVNPVRDDVHSYVITANGYKCHK